MLFRIEFHFQWITFDLQNCSSFCTFMMRSRISCGWKWKRRKKNIFELKWTHKIQIWFGVWEFSKNMNESPRGIENHWDFLQSLGHRAWQLFIICIYSFFLLRQEFRFQYWGSLPIFFFSMKFEFFLFTLKFEWMHGTSLLGYFAPFIFKMTFRKFREKRLIETKRFKSCS